MSPVLGVLLPDALVIGLGVVMRRFVPDAGWAGIDRLNFQILFPALIFQAAAARAPGLNDLAVIGGGVWAIILLGFGLGLLLRPLGPARFLDFAGAWQTAWRFNSAIGLVAVQALPESARGLMSIAIGFAVPLANLLAVGAMSRGQSMSLGATARMVVLNPFLLASTLGIGMATAGLHLPDPLSPMVGLLAQAAIPMALLSIGAALEIRAVTRLDPFRGGLSLIKLVVLPALTLGAVRLMGLEADAAAVLVVFAALPTASAAHVLASVFGADRSLAAGVIAQSTALGCVTLPLWLMGLQG
ncbi:AEC family transporter [Phaeovulum vinaykumarii]|uniref:AEC family transporter n=1 Tax=Phaeovulum vinaykumarii TaxID=407234 RepID=A0A1N7LK27_9RHOB|nr:AEC family transporter [Phaeovulum vinaykumarii]SIS74101.1 hypothetical protein SAMN05421795_103139 [Phaeovulum vinaykumarii]SOC04883.1 hypothetical protein SAMN05878426_103139 [Phaeovulum vinaykumarii]